MAKKRELTRRKLAEDFPVLGDGREPVPGRGVPNAPGKPKERGHKRLSEEAMRRALDETFQLLAEADKAITDAEERDRRMAVADNQSREDQAKRFPALGGRTVSPPPSGDEIFHD